MLRRLCYRIPYMPMANMFQGICPLHQSSEIDLLPLELRDRTFSSELWVTGHIPSNMLAFLHCVVWGSILVIQVLEVQGTLLQDSLYAHGLPVSRDMRSSSELCGFIPWKALNLLAFCRVVFHRLFRSRRSSTGFITCSYTYSFYE